VKLTLRKFQNIKFMEAKLQEIRNKLIDAALVGVLIISVPTLTTSVLRYFQIGWQWIYPFHLALAITGFIVYFRRKRLSVRFKAHFLSILFLVLSFLGAIKFSLSGGIYACLGTVAICTLIFGKRTGLIYAIVSITGLTIIGLLYSFHILPNTIDFNLFNFSITSWLAGLFTILYLMSMIIHSIGLFYDFYNQNIKDLLKKTHEQEIAQKELKNSEERYRLLVENAVFPVTVTNLEGEVLFSNQSADAFFGIEFHKFERKNISEFWITPNARLDFLEELITKGFVQNKEIEIYGENKQVRTILLSANIIDFRDETAIFSIYNDISERKKAVNALSSLATSYANLTGKSFFEAVSKHIAKEMELDYVFIGELIESKDSVRVLGGCAYGEAMGELTYTLNETPCRNVIGKSICFYPDKIQEIFPNDLLLNQLSIEGYIAAPLFDNEQKSLGIIVALNTKPILNKEIIVHFFNYFIDRVVAEMLRSRAQNELLQEIKERKIIEANLLKSEMMLKEQNEEYLQLNEELTSLNINYREAKEKAEESERLKTAFLLNMSHEVRTPMNAIIGFSNMLHDSDLTAEKRKEYTSIIISSSNRLQFIIDDIMTISKLETNQEEVKIHNVCVNDILDNLLEIYQFAAKDKKILLNSRFDLPDDLSKIYSDKNKIKQILSHLIDNAIKFTSRGYVKFGYSLQNADPTSNSEQHLLFFVMDSGIGISNEIKNKIFERFAQAETEITRNYGGTGLGLSIAKGFVELLGGKIWVESNEDKGSTFYFTIPYKPVKEEN